MEIRKLNMLNLRIISSKNGIDSHIALATIKYKNGGISKDVSFNHMLNF